MSSVHVCLSFFVFLTNMHCYWHTNYRWRGSRRGEFANYRVNVCVCVHARVCTHVRVHEHARQCFPTEGTCLGA